MYDLDKIKEKINCIDYAQRIGLPIKKAGDRCISPLRTGARNKTSFIVYEDFWYDFGSAMGGDVIDFCAFCSHGGDRGKAIKELAELTGVKNDGEGNTDGWFNYTKKLNGRTAYYQTQLTERDKEYLHSRGLKDEDIERLRIGRTEEGRLFLPYFKNGYVCYYATRYMEGGEYPDTKYKKAPIDDYNQHIVWGLHTLNDNNDTLIIAEGYFDAVSFEVEGHSVLSAITGHFSKAQLPTVLSAAKNFKKVFIIFDNDTDSHAGEGFTIKMAKLLYSHGINFTVGFTPEGIKDVNDYYAGGGKLQELIDKAIPGEKFLQEKAPQDFEELKNFTDSIRTAIAEDKIIVLTGNCRDEFKLKYILDKKYKVINTSHIDNFNILREARVYVIDETNKNKIKRKLYDIVKELRIIDIPGNKSVAEWIEDKHTVKDLYNCFYKSLDLKNIYELQQDFRGIYKTVKNQKGEEQETTITNFNIISAESINYLDGEPEEIEIKLKNRDFTKTIKDSITIFNDVKSFRNALGSSQLSYYGNITDLIALKDWITRYFIHNTYEAVKGNRFMKYNGEMILALSDGSLKPDGTIDKKIKSKTDININLPSEPISRDELEDLTKYLFDFSTRERTYTILGTVINNFAVCQAEELGIKLHHLAIIGQAGSGKSTILERAIMPLINCKADDKKSAGGITNFAMISDLSEGNYMSVYDEYKPSSMDPSRVRMFCNNLRNSYDRLVASRGTVHLNVNKFQLGKPVIVAGEESFTNQEAALLERSNIVYLSKNERTEENIKAMAEICKREVLLNKLGKALIDIVLNISLEDYKTLRATAEDKIKGIYDEMLYNPSNSRILNTVINVATGLEIFNILLSKFELPIISEYAEAIVSNVKNDVIGEAGHALSAVERVLLALDEYIYTDMFKKYCEDILVLDIGSDFDILIRTNPALAGMRKFAKDTNSDILILSDSDFKKQAMKEGYITSTNYQKKIGPKNIKWHVYDKKKLELLGLSNIVNSESNPIEDGKVIEGHFNKVTEVTG